MDTKNKETAWYIKGKKLPTWFMIIGYILLFVNAVDSIVKLISHIKAILF
ncbi:hypothetical protein HZY83_02040 [Gemella sp. GH3]|nr:MULTISPECIES: hypothetical protein [unclassified Gemella]MBF0713469.1 hypothetical protein [Gemella sp. GH3.1]NYS50421.1 hypothetical protein [Gemella sp. GH3]